MAPSRLECGKNKFRIDGGDGLERTKRLKALALPTPAVQKASLAKCIPDARFRRQDIHAQQDCIFAEMCHELRLTYDDGSPFDWEICHPSMLLQTMVRRSPLLQDAYGRAANMRRDEPWHLVIGFDEYVPGSKFLIDTNRKSMNLSFNFVEVGPDMLAHDITWPVGPDQ